MVEVFKTNVKCPLTAQLIIADILTLFLDMEVSFDLDDNDGVLRLDFEKDIVSLVFQIQQIVKNQGCTAELLNPGNETTATASQWVATGKNVGLSALLNIF